MCYLFAAKGCSGVIMTAVRTFGLEVVVMPQPQVLNDGKRHKVLAVDSSWYKLLAASDVPTCRKRAGASNFKSTIWHPKNRARDLIGGNFHG